MQFLSTNVTGKEEKSDILEMFQLFDDEKIGYITMAGLRRIAASNYMGFDDEDLE